MKRKAHRLPDFGVEQPNIEERSLRDLPPYLARLCDKQLLTADEERELFRRMNYLKFRAAQLREEIDVDRPRSQLLEEAEQCLTEAAAVRAHIVQSNARLVVAIVKKFVSPQHSFDELLSDGMLTLLNAAEKFDYDRGFRFSTYATRAIRRNL